MPVLGLGTWRMGESAARRAAEVRALRAGLDLGMTLIDTAEMYGAGGAERVVAEAIEGRRAEVFLVTKVLPENASPDDAVLACEGSLRRLGVETIDLYLLHWPGRYPLEGTLEAFMVLRQQGKIAHYGLSNFDTAEMKDAEGMLGGSAIACDQVLYSVAHRGIEWSLIPWCRERGIAVMAYSPLEQGGLRTGRSLERVADRHGVSPECIALAWAIREPGVVAIPKSSSERHVRENARAASIHLQPDDLAEIDRDHKPPTRKRPLDTA